MLRRVIDRRSQAVRHLGVAVRRWRRRGALTLPDWERQFAVRRDWPDGSHDIFGLTVDRRRAATAALSLPTYWRRSTFRPVQSVVEISEREFELHRLRDRGRVRCMAPDCPTSAARTLSEIDGLVWR